VVQGVVMLSGTGRQRLCKSPNFGGTLASATVTLS
jgi:hypothetical protein